MKKQKEKRERLFSLMKDENDVIQEWNSAVADTQKLLQTNTEWKSRYAAYAARIADTGEIVGAVRRKLHEWEPLKLYLNFTNLMNAGKTVNFDLRYLGQNVAELRCSNDLKLYSKKYDATNLRDFGCGINLSGDLWDGSEAQKFRKHFKNHQVNGEGSNPGNEEHRLESLLLTEMSKKKDKLLTRMKPVTIGGVRVPVPTPLKASNHKSVGYSKQYGGGIDIFARGGTGGLNTNLCIIELKDENLKKEPPKEAVKQALVYTTFIRELLRSDSGECWWKLFGFSRGIPDQLKLNAICAMPSSALDDTSFKGREISIGGNDIAVLHYIYFTESNNTITSVNSSLME